MTTRAVAVLLLAALLWTSIGATGADTRLHRRERLLLQAEGTVSSGNPELIQDSIAELDSGAVLNIDPDTIELTEPIRVNKSLTIRGTNSKSILKCSGQTSAIEVRAGDVIIENLAIEDCATPAVLLENPSFRDSFAIPEENFTILSATIQGSNFSNNGNTSSLENGGAVRMTGGWDLRIENCEFVGNGADSGGAIFGEGSKISITRSLFKQNSAWIKGGALAVEAMRSNVGLRTTLEISNCTFFKNRNIEGGVAFQDTLTESGLSIEPSKFIIIPEPGLSGGALFVLHLDDVTVQNSRFVENKGAAAGGAIFMMNVRKSLIDGVIFSLNRALQVEDPFAFEESENLSLGGALYMINIFKVSMQIDNCTFHENQALYGGALHIVGVSGFQARIDDSVFVENQGRWGGGAAVFREMRTIWAGNTVKSNSARVGGGLVFTNGARVFLQSREGGEAQDLFEENYALQGGAILLYGAGESILQASNFTRNRALGLGGAIAIIDGQLNSILSMRGVNFRENSAEQGGAIWADRTPTLLIGAFVTLSETRGCSFEGNVALDGGALFYTGISNTGNFIRVSFSTFERNSALEEMDDILKVNEDALASMLALLGEDRVIQEWVSFRRERSLFDPSGRSYGNGCGGAMCLDLLTGGSGDGGIQILLESTSIENNRAKIGGGAMIVTAGGDWLPECPTSGIAPVGSIGCRSILIGKTVFKSNQASGAGGGLFTTNVSRIWALDENEPVTIEDVADNDEFFSGNSVAGMGFGKDMATEVARIELKNEANKGGLVVAKHASGENLKELQLEVFDGLDQLMTEGIPSANLLVDISSDVVVGESLSESQNGTVRFQNILAIGLPGIHPLRFHAPDGFNVEPVPARISIRDCFTGEERQDQQGICRRCPEGFFTFDPDEICRPCPDNAVCSGGSALIPVDGFWHSTPFSPEIHECLVREACSYANRNLTLLSFYSEDIMPSNETLSNEAFPQCSTGYEGIVCGSCSDGYGKQHGTCKKCRSAGASRFYIAAAGFWSLILLGVTIRSAIISINEMDQMTSFLEGASATPQEMAQRRETLPTDVPSQLSGLGGPSQLSGLGGPSQLSIHSLGERSSRMLGSVHANDVLYKILFRRNKSSRNAPVTMSSDEANMLAAFGGLQGQNLQAALEKIRPVIAAENLSETVKIWTNYLQVTSFAIEINANWTKSIQEMLAVQDFVAGFSSAEALVSAECAIGDDPSMLAASVGGSLIRISYPAILFTVVALLFVLVWLPKRKSRPSALHQLQVNLIIALTAVLFFSYIELSEEFMRSVNCVDLDASKPGTLYSIFATARSKYWAEDTYLICFEGDHTVLAAVGVIGLIVVTLGIPVALLLFMLRLRKNDQLFDGRYMHKFGFVYQAYKREACYWEVCILLRKALIVAAVVYMRPLGPNMQGIIALGVLNVALILHLFKKPFKYTHLNWLESASLIISIVTIYSGLLFNDPNTDFAGRVTVSVVVMAGNLGIVLVIMSRAVTQFDRYATGKLIAYKKAIPRNPLVKYVKFMTYFVLTSLPKKTEIALEAKIYAVLGIFGVTQDDAETGSHGDVQRLGDLPRVSPAPSTPGGPEIALNMMTSGSLR